MVKTNTAFDVSAPQTCHWRREKTKIQVADKPANKVQGEVSRGVRRFYDFPGDARAKTARFMCRIRIVGQSFKTFKMFLAYDITRRFAIQTRNGAIFLRSLFGASYRFATVLNYRHVRYLVICEHFNVNSHFCCCRCRTRNAHYRNDVSSRYARTRLLRRVEFSGRSAWCYEDDWRNSNVMRESGEKTY